MKLTYVSKLGAKLHAPKTARSVGYDIETPIDINLYPGESMLVDTGIIVRLPEVEGKRFHIKIYPRSSTKFVLFNSVGVIDPDYCGPNDTLKLRIYRPDIELAANRRHILPYTRGQRGREFSHVYDAENRITHYSRNREVGEIQCVYTRASAYPDPLLYKAGDRFAQLVIESHEIFEMDEVSPEDYTSETNRGGFGSTGQRG